MLKRFKPIQRTALDGKNYWCIYDMKEKRFSTFLCHGKYKTRKDAEMAILLGKIK